MPDVPWPDPPSGPPSDEDDAPPRNARERTRVGPRGEPLGSKGVPDGLTGSGHGTADPETDVRPGRGAWIPSQGSAGEGMPAQRRGRALEPEERGGSERTTEPEGA
jgi:hypothetical protein